MMTAFSRQADLDGMRTETYEAEEFSKRSDYQAGASRLSHSSFSCDLQDARTDSNTVYLLRRSRLRELGSERPINVVWSCDIRFRRFRQVLKVPRAVVPR